MGFTHNTRGQKQNKETINGQENPLNDLYN